MDHGGQSSDRDINNWVKDCQTCSRAKVARQPATAIHPIPVPQQRFYHIHVDLVDPLPVSKEGFRYLFTILDTYSMLLEAVLLALMEAKKCAEVLLTNWVSRFRVPAGLTSHQGTQFTSTLCATPAKPWGSNTLTPQPTTLKVTEW